MESSKLEAAKTLAMTEDFLIFLEKNKIEGQHYNEDNQQFADFYLPYNGYMIRLAYSAKDKKLVELYSINHTPLSFFSDTNALEVDEFLLRHFFGFFRKVMVA